MTKVLKVGPNSSILSPDGTAAVPGDVIEIPFHEETITVTYGSDKRWRDEDGCVYGFTDPDSSGDPVVRCGVRLLSLPSNDPLTDACRGHDYIYSCPAAQDSITRKEADRMLYRNIEIIGRGWRHYMALPFYLAVRVLGFLFWDNPKTNN